MSFLEEQYRGLFRILNYIEDIDWRRLRDIELNIDPVSNYNQEEYEFSLSAAKIIFSMEKHINGYRVKNIQGIDRVVISKLVKTFKNLKKKDRKGAFKMLQEQLNIRMSMFI
jgi:hypothetical protein